MPPLSWRHHTMVQMLLSRGPLKEDDFRSVFSQLTGKGSGAQKEKLFNEYLKKINGELSYVQFELRAFRNQYDGTVYYGVVNNVLDEQSKLGTKYTVPQIAFYRGVVEAIIQDADASGRISNTDALSVRLEMQVNGATGSQGQGGSSQVPTAFKTFTMSQKEKALDQLVKDQWLCLTPEGEVGLGVRSFLDLRSWFRANDVPLCEVCNEAAVKAQRCQNEACKVRLHQYCVAQKFSQQRVEKVCPSCSTEWLVPIVKSEYVHDRDDSSFPSQSRQPSQRSTGKKRRAHREVDADTVETESYEDPTPTPKRTTRRSSRLNAS